MAQANYGGKSPPISAYQKFFNYGNNTLTWNYSTTNSQLLLKPVNPKATVYINGDLIVGGSLNNPSDFHLKDNIEDLSLCLTDNLMKLTPKKYTYKDDTKQKTHFGLIAQEVESFFPNLVNTVSTQIADEEFTIKSVNYLEIIPLLLLKIKDLQTQIDELKK
jgi:Chaperone of endosialidase